MIATSFEQFKILPKNKGKDSKILYREWLLEENKLLMLQNSYHMLFQMQLNNYNLDVYGPFSPAAGGSEDFAPPIPSNKVTYYTPNGSSGLPLGYYTPDLDDLVNSYYIYV